MQTRFYIFLDVDGVLHPTTWRIPGLVADAAKGVAEDPLTIYARSRGYRAVWNGLPFSRLSEFEQSVRPFLDHLEIVISSSWRADPVMYEAILEAMSNDVRRRVVGATPVASPSPFGYGRPFEVHCWLKEHANPNGLAIVIDDDETHEWRHITSQVVLLLMDTSRGFTPEDSRDLNLLLSMDPQTIAALKAALPKLHGQRTRLEWIATTSRNPEQ